MKETKSENGCSSMEEMLKDCLQGLQEKIAKEGWLGISSGFRPLDDLTDGHWASLLSTISWRRVLCL